MPRQNFLTRDSFVDASERQATDSIYSIPAFASNISLVTENKVLGFIRFCYEQPQRQARYFIDVSVLYLNDQCTRVCLHGTHLDGKAFSHSSDMALALHDFEDAIQAAIKGDASLYKPCEPKQSISKKIGQFAAGFTAALSLFLLRKKLS